MAASVTLDERTVFGNKRVSFATVTMDSSYPTGGESVTAAQLGLSSVHRCDAQVAVATGGGVNVANANYSVTTNKVLLYDETPAEVANAADVSTTVVKLIAYGV